MEVDHKNIIIAEILECAVYQYFDGVELAKILADIKALEIKKNIEKRGK